MNHINHQLVIYAHYIILIVLQQVDGRIAKLKFGTSYAISLKDLDKFAKKTLKKNTRLREGQLARRLPPNACPDMLTYADA